VGLYVQEVVHPLYPDIGGLAILHMQQLREEVGLENGLFQPVFEALKNLLIGLSVISLDDLERQPAWIALGQFPVDYTLFCLFLMSFEIKALYRNHERWLPNEYNHQFDHNIGLTNLRENYSNGDYGFDPLNLKPTDPDDYKNMAEKELSNGRLAMVAVIGIIAQEYFTGLPILQAATESTTGDTGTSLSLVESIISLPSFFQQQFTNLVTGQSSLPRP